MDGRQFYFQQDLKLLFDILRSEISYLKNSWIGVGRPTVTISISSSVLGRWIQHFSGSSQKIKKIHVLGNYTSVKNARKFSWGIIEIKIFFAHLHKIKVLLKREFFLVSMRFYRTMKTVISDT